MSDMHNTGWDQNGILPNPGSRKALDMGCLCPTMDNGHGLGYGSSKPESRVWVQRGGCPVHWPEKASV